MYFIKTPTWLQRLFPRYTWRVPTREKVLYLTFDDGPIPEVTPSVLAILRRYKAKATFFCVGDNVNKHPEVFEQVLTEGHTIGNHTFHHLNGWATRAEDYLQNISACAERVRSRLFRPPYGKIKPQQAEWLFKNEYKIVMWDVLSGDFDTQITGERCLQNIINHAAEGSVVVFHDSQKAADRVLYALPRVLEHYAAQGYRFAAIPH